VRIDEIDLAARQMRLGLVAKTGGRAPKDRGIAKTLSEVSTGPGRGRATGRRGRIEGRRAKSFRKRGGRR